MQISRIYIAFLFVVSFVLTSNAQFAHKKLGKKHQAYSDSLRQVEYNYLFPIFGQAAYKKGFDIPYPAGIMGNYMWMRQGILIDNLQLGLKTDDRDIGLTPVDFIKFGDNLNTSWTTNVRPDIWIFPFLNVYGIFGYGESTTEVKLTAPIGLTSVVKQNISTAGVGLMGAFGIGKMWVSIDGNFTWNKPDLLDEAVRVNVMGIRLGHTLTHQSKPERNVAFWVGGMRAKMESVTSGQIKLSDALSQDTWDRKDEIVDNYFEWYNGLDPVDQWKADKVLTPIVEKIDEADGSAVIKYSMDKQVLQMWNFIIGAQYQINKRWMIRSEGGVIGDRKSFLLSLNYRFLI